MNITQSIARLASIGICGIIATIPTGADAADLSIEEIAIEELSVEQLSAEQIIQRFDQRYDGDTAIAEYTMVLIDSRERQRTRNLRIYSKDYGDDKKTLTLFQTPADIRGTAYLNFDWDDTELDDDSWLYLPSIQRVKRLASSDKSDSFLGSDFTYADINGFEIEWYDYSFINESISGDTTSGGLARIEKILDKYQPKIILLELGANDGLRGLSPQKMQTNLAQMIKLSQNAGAKVLLLSMRIPPNYGKRYTEMFYQVYPSLSAELSIPYVPFILDDVALVNELMQKDGLHPNAKAQPIIADKIWKHLYQLLHTLI